MPLDRSFFLSLAVFLFGAVSSYADQLVIKINGGEETITRTPNYTAKTVTTVSSKGWSKTESFNNLGLTQKSKLDGPGIPLTQLTPVWRADGSLESVSLKTAGIINENGQYTGGETHSASFNNDGTLASLIVPGKGDILGGHSISGGTETLTVDGVTNVTKLDGTEHSISGADIIGKTDTLAPLGNGYQETIHPSTGADTSTTYNAAGAATAKNYAVGAGEGYGYTNGLLTSVSLARGGSLTYGYSNDGAKDLKSATWPIVASGVFTIPAITESYGYDRAGRINEIGDASGVRGITYQNGRATASAWTTGTLRGYQLIKSYDGGREIGYTLKRDNVVIHSSSRTFTGDIGESSEPATVTSGNLTVILNRNNARQLTGIQWGTGSNAPTQSWTRGTAGRILSASSNVSGAPSFNYKGTANNEATAFDAKGRRLKCATTGGEWTYQYTNGQLTSAVHPTLGSFTYAFDGIGRRTDKGTSNTTDLLNRTLAWTNSQNKTVKVVADPDARVWFNGTEIPDFSGTYSYPITPPGASGGWVPWNTLAVLEGEGDIGANADAKAEQSGAVWVPPISENFEYDDAGNRQNNALWDFGWNAKNQLVRARTKNHNTSTTPQGYDITNAYDAEGKRFSKKVKRYQNGSAVEQKIITFLYDGDDIIYEREQYPSGLTTCERKYVWGPDISGTHGGAGGAGGLLLIRETKGGTTIDLYPLYDGTGHVIGLSTMVDGTATLVAEYAYGPFGETIYARGPHAQSCPFRYATKYYDQETGLYDFGKRYLDPITGQWISREPLGESESANLFSYCHNDPVNKVDVLGLFEYAWYEGGAARTLTEGFLGFVLDRGANLAISVPQTGYVVTGWAHSAMGSGGINDDAIAALESKKNPYGRQGYYSMSSAMDHTVMGLADVGTGFAIGGLKVGAVAIESDVAVLSSQSAETAGATSQMRQAIAQAEVILKSTKVQYGNVEAFARMEGNTSPLMETWNQASKRGTPLLKSQFSKNSLAYVRAIESRTGFTLHASQRARLIENLRTIRYSRLTPEAGRTFRKAFTTRLKNQQIAEWETQTAQIWPRYADDLYNSEGALLRKAGDPYDAHHVIENVYGGPHEWWNLTPARFPDQHQGGIHLEEIMEILFPN